MSCKFISGAEAAAIVKDDMTVCVDGFIGFSLAEDILTEMENSYIYSGHPKKLNLINIAGIGGDGKNRGINHFAHDGFLSSLLCSNLSLGNKVYPYIENNSFSVHMMPQGVLSHMMRAISGGQVGVITHVGLNTFVDPRIDGGCINSAAFKTGKKVAELIKLNGREQLFYPAFPIDIAILKGSSADMVGNISLTKEAFRLEQFEVAAAAKNSGGTVIVQVDELLPEHSITPQNVAIPASLVDYVVVGRREHSKQQFAVPETYVPSWSGEERIDLGTIAPLPFGIRKLIASRAAMEISKDDFVNFGIGIPTDISAVLNENGLTDQVTLSIESGVIGGVPASGLATGAAYNPCAIVKQPDIFDFYNGGGIDVACLGGAQFDSCGNVNVSKFAGRTPGPGGFINITQNAKKVCFVATFTAGKSKITIENGRLNIIEDAPGIKFKNKVEHITFSGEYSIKSKKQKVLYITERCVFKLTAKGLELIEIAPGIDIEKDILNRMEFVPLISKNLKLMDNRLFLPKPFKLNLPNKT